MATRDEVANLVVTATLDSSGFKQGMQDLNRQMTLVKSQFKAASAGLGNFGSESDKLQLQADKLNSMLQLQQQKVDMLTEQYDETAAATGENSKQTQNLAIQLNNAKAVLANMGNELKATNIALEENAEGMSASGEATERAAVEQKSFGESVESTKEGIESTRLAMVGMMGLMAGGMLGEWTEGAETMAVNLQTLQEETGESRDELERLALVSSGAGVSMSELGQMVGRMDKSVQTAETPTKSLQNALQDLGVSAEEFSKAPIPDQAKMIQEAMEKSHLPAKQLSTDLKAIGVTSGDISKKGTTNLESIQLALEKTADSSSTLARQLTAAGINFQQFANADTEGKIQMLGKYMEDTNDKAKATALVMSVFGRSGQQMLPLIKNFGELDGYAKSLKMPVMNTEEIQLAAEKTKMLQTAMQMMMDSVLVKILPLVDNVGKAFYNLVANISHPVKAISGFVNALGPAAALVTAFIGAFAGMKVINAVMDTFKNFGSAVSSMTRLLSPLRIATEAETEAQEAADATMVANPIGIVITAIAGLVVGIYELVKHWKTVQAVLSAGWTWLKSTVTGIFGWVRNFISGIWNGIVADIQSFVEGFDNGFVPMQTTMETIFAWVGNLVWSVVNGVTSAWNAVTTTTTKVWGAISSFFRKWGVDLLAIFVPVIGIPILIAQHWSQITGIASNIWTSVTSGIKKIWSGFTSWIAGAAKAVGDAVVDAFSWMYNHNYYFKDLVDFITHAFAVLKQDTSAVWDAIETVLSTVWNAVANTAKTIWNGITKMFSDVWNTIKNTAKTFWDDEVNGWKNIWNDVVSAAKAIWNGLTKMFSAVWSAIKSAATKFWNDEVNGWKNIWRNAVSAVKSIFNPIVSFFRGIWSSIHSGVSSGWNAITGGIHSAVSSAIKAIESPFRAIGSFFSSLWSSARSWGSNLIKMVVSGIQSEISSVENAVKGVANKIKSFLGFHSPAEEGPGSDADTWMPNLMSMLVQGVQAGTPTLRAALNQALALPSFTVPNISIPNVAANTSAIVGQPSNAVATSQVNNTTGHTVTVNNYGPLSGAQAVTNELRKLEMLYGQ